MLAFDFFPTLVGGMSSGIPSACATSMSSFGRTQTIHFESRASGRFPPIMRCSQGRGCAQTRTGFYRCPSAETRLSANDPIADMRSAC